MVRQAYSELSRQCTSLLQDIEDLFFSRRHMPVMTNHSTDTAKAEGRSILCVARTQSPSAVDERTLKAQPVWPSRCG